MGSVTDVSGGNGSVLAAALHDPHGHQLGGLRRLAGPLREVFDVFGVQVTSETAPEVVGFLHDELGAVTGRAPADAASIGLPAAPARHRGDLHDHDSAVWISRVEIAYLHARALKRLLHENGS